MISRAKSLRKLSFHRSFVTQKPVRLQGADAVQQQSVSADAVPVSGFNIALTEFSQPAHFVGRSKNETLQRLKHADKVLDKRNDALNEEKISQFVRIIGILQKFHENPEDEEIAKYVKSQYDISVFKYVSSNLAAFHNFYYSKSKQLRHKISLEGALAANRALLSQEYDKCVSIQSKLLNLYRDLFKYSLIIEDVSSEFQFSDFKQMIELELKNYKMSAVKQLFEYMESRKSLKLVGDIHYWNFKLKIYGNAMHQLWQSPEIESARVSKVSWRGKLPFKTDALEVIYELQECIESGLVTPNIVTFRYMILAYGGSGNLDGLKQHLSEVWFDKKNTYQIVPECEFLNAIITSFGYNYNFVQGLEAVLKLDKEYGILNNATKQDLKRFWLTLFKWADFGEYNEELCSNLFRTYIKENNVYQYDTIILAKRLRQLESSKAVDTMFEELPIIYHKYLTTWGDSAMTSLMYRYLCSILDSLFHEQNLINFEQIGFASKSDTILKEIEENGIIFMYNKEQDFFSGNTKINYFNELNKVTNTYSVARNKKSVEELKNAFANSDIDLKYLPVYEVLKFYMVKESGYKEMFLQKYVKLVKEYSVNKEKYQKHFEENYKKQQDKYDEQDDEFFIF